MLSIYRQISTRFSALTHHGQGKIAHILPVLGIGFLVAGGVSLARLGGWLEAAELVVYDRMLSLRPPEPPDSRLLIVQVTEEDIKSQQQWPLSGETLYQVLTTIDRYEPAGIGLDIYRNIPVEPGHQQLSQLLATNKFIAPICLVSSDQNPGVEPPARINSLRLGFANIPVDSGGIVRRALIFADPPPASPCQTQYSLGFQLARLYLQQQKIAPQLTANGELQLNQIVFPRLSKAAGGYQQVETAGYQLLLNYRCTVNLASCSPTNQIVTLNDVLQGRLTRSQVEGKMVLIGASAPSIDDAFYTPYSQGNVTQRMPGVAVHAQVASQLVSTALGERRLLWYLPEGANLLLIFGWAIAGAFSLGWTRHLTPSLERNILKNLSTRSRIFIVGGGSLLWLGMITGGFLLGGWFPVVATGLSWTLSILGVGSYQLYLQRQKARAIAQQLQAQQQDLALLRSLLQEQISPANQSTQTLGAKLETDWTTTAMPPEALAQLDLDATAISPPMPPPVPKTLDKGRYLLGKVLGSGGFGKTYLAQDSQNPQQPTCVIKHLQPARKDIRFLEVARRLFRNEGEILARLGSHPQIPELIAYFEEKNDFYLVEEYIPGEPLSEELVSGEQWQLQAVLDLLQQSLAILDFIHSQGVIHRDLKPNNIMRTPQGKLVLIDFGAVKQISPQDPNLQINGVPGQVSLEEDTAQKNWTIAIGTKGYAPPEQYAGQPNFSSDIYALGMIVVEALTGVHPLNLPINVATGEADWHGFVQIPENVKLIIDQMIRFHFPDRYQSARKILEDLNYLL